jgi:hypothetical protein
MDVSRADVVSNATTKTSADPDIIAIGLLTLEQKLSALDRLYNEEVSTLCRELAQLKADYVRYHRNAPNMRKP